MNTDSEIHRKLDLIIELLQTQKAAKGRSGNLYGSDSEIHRQRVEALETLFFKLHQRTTGARREQLNYGVALLEGRLDPYIQAVPVATLVNQASMRKIFRKVAKGESSKVSPVEVARNVLADSNLVVMSLKETNLKTDSAVLVAFSPAQALLVAKHPENLPQRWKGWTTDERGAAKPTVGNDGKALFVDPIEDVSGARVWDAGDLLEKTLEEQLGPIFEQEQIKGSPTKITSAEEKRKLWEAPEPEKPRAVFDKSAWSDFADDGGNSSEDEFPDDGGEEVDLTNDGTESEERDDSNDGFPPPVARKPLNISIKK